MQYTVMNPEQVINHLNALPTKGAIAATTQLRNIANEQTQWEEVPPIIGDPLLTGGPQPAPIDRVRGNIQNTVRFTETILEVLAA